MQVRDVVSSPVFTIQEDKKLLAVEAIMQWSHIRHVPVVNKSGRVVGILSHRDLMQAAVSSLAIRISDAERSQHLAGTEVRSIMKAPPQTIGPTEPVQRAAHLMRSHKWGCLPVVEGGRLVGIVTEADLLGIVEGLEVIHERRAG